VKYLFCFARKSPVPRGFASALPHITRCGKMPTPAPPQIYNVRFMGLFPWHNGDIKQKARAKAQAEGEQI